MLKAFSWYAALHRRTVRGTKKARNAARNSQLGREGGHIKETPGKQGRGRVRGTTGRDNGQGHGHGHGLRGGWGRTTPASLEESRHHSPAAVPCITSASNPGSDRRFTLYLHQTKGVSLLHCMHFIFLCQVRKRFIHSFYFTTVRNFLLVSVHFRGVQFLNSFFFFFGFLPFPLSSGFVARSVHGFIHRSKV